MPKPSLPRKITTHQIEGSETQLRITADGPGPGGASHEYRILWGDRYGHLNSCDIKFQEGGVEEINAERKQKNGINGVNGVTNEALLAVVMDNLEGFQAGDFACSENAEALKYLKAAIGCLQDRTKARIARGVEGKSEK